MRILALVTDAFGGYGGIAQYNRDFISGLAASHRVHGVVMLPRLGHATPSCPIPTKVQQLPPIWSKTHYSLAAIHAALMRGPFDLIFCGHINAVPLASLVGKMLKRPIWLQTHGIDAWARPSWIMRQATAQCALITTVSRFTRRRMLQWAPIDPSRVRVLPNTVRPLFSPGPASEPQLQRLGLAGRKIVLTVSRISKADVYKGHDRVIKALPAVRGIHPDAIYVIVGDGDGRGDLEALTTKLKLQSHVKFLGRLGDNDLLGLCRAASAFIMPSTKEGFGIVFAEAAAAGLPVIAGHCDGSADALGDGVIGTLIDPLSESEITQALISALDGKLIAAPSEVQRFSFEHFTKHIDDLLEHIAH